MSKGSGGSQTVNTDPWIGAQDSISNVLGNARSMFDSGAGFYTPMNDHQTLGLNLQRQYADQLNNRFLSPYQNWSQTMLERPGANDNPFGIGGAISNNLNLFSPNSGATGQGIDANPYNINTAIQQGLTAPNSISGNPVLEQYMKAATRPFEQKYNFETAPGIRSAFGMSQPGGGSRQGVAEGVAQGLRDQGIMDTRAGIANNAYNQSLGQQANALSAATQNYGIGAGREATALSAANQAYGQGLDAQGRAMALYPQMLQTGLMPSQLISNIGNTYQADQNAGQTDQWDRLNAYASLVNGVPIQGTGRQLTGGGSGSNPMMGALGGGLGGYTLGNMLGYSLGPWGAALGALGGLLG